MHGRRFNFKVVVAVLRLLGLPRASSPASGVKTLSKKSNPIDRKKFWLYWHTDLVF
jgi:hypothetical protein